MIKMADLKASLEKDGFLNARTYIQSGNVIFESAISDVAKLERSIQASIEKHYGIRVELVVLSKDEWQAIINAAPKSWGTDKKFKHNLLVMLRPYDMKQVETAIGELKPGIESSFTGEGVLYQSLSWDSFGRTTGGKIASNPIYKRMTIRNYNTAVKLLELLEEASST